MYLNDEAVLKVENLRVGFGEEEKREVVRNISFQIKKGEVLCLVGESGSGKSVTAFSIMQLFHGTTGMILGGKILVNGTNLAELSEKEMQKRRGNEIAMVFQEPMTSLNPVITIGVQMARAMRLHQKLEKQKVREKSIQLLEKVGIKHAEKTLYAYPHEVSGGMRQRIMIAMAMINKPSLLICDEPTSALDVIVQDQIIKLIKSLCVQEGEQLENILNNTFKEIEDITDVHQMTNQQLKRLIQKIEVDKDGNVDIYLRLLGDLGLDESVLIDENETVQKCNNQT